ncbi:MULTISPECIES: A24 family peptidase [Actinomycetes]|uniref:A24 family peptidase n=1 Tax=Actinomycetes TaxID=1760 RepID=UPI00068FEE6C|nr:MULTISPECIES: A24 family peptidase [Actinomycetes]
MAPSIVGVVQMLMPVLAIWFVALSVSDVRTRRLPNVLTVPAAVASLVAVAIHPAATPGLVVAVGVYLVAFSLRACGGGDVKLAITVGALAGSVVAVLAVIVLAHILTVVPAVVIGDRRPQPHGPALCAATALVCGIW